ncbi:MAG: ATP-binding cassette domain-containing protein [Pirellulaceae bacterium]
MKEQLMSPASSESELPALYECETQRMHPLGTTDCFVVGRSQQVDLPLIDPECSRQQFRVVRQANQFLLESLSHNTPTRCNGKVVDSSVALSHGALIEVGTTRFRFVAERKPLRGPFGSGPVSQPDQIRGAGSVSSQSSTPSAMSAEPTPSSVDPSSSVPNSPGSSLAPPGASANHGGGQIPGGSPRLQTMLSTGSGEQEDISLDSPIVLDSEMLIGRDRERVQIHLPHTQVSRIHARVSMDKGTVVVADLDSTNGTFINGQRMTGPAILRCGDRITVGPYALTFDGVYLQPCSRENNVELVCRDIRRVVKDRTSGRSLTLLDDITLVVRPKEFMCLLGPSGSGKSTLLSALSARMPADKGTVTINGEDFYGTFDALKQDVAVVPQKDVLHDLLSLETAIDSTAKLRLPSDVSNPERQTAINEMLETVNLTERRKMKIQHLSGGQVKRASLANEIISKPSLLFLDEVTSGLDEQTDREMMELFRKIADGGKTVVCITHSLANVEKNCHLVVILTPGGKLAFVGSPAEALKYFEIKQLGDVYQKLMTKPAEEWKQAFLQHPFYNKYVTSRLPIDEAVSQTPVARQQPTVGERLELFVRQLKVLTDRYLRITVADTRSMAMVLGQCLLVAVLLVILFGNLEELQFAQEATYSRSLLFLMAISCLWFGCNNAAKEIVKERTIYTRERDINLMITSYYGSKVLLLGLLSVGQSLLLFVIVKSLTGLAGSAVGQGLFFAVLAFVGVTIGLLISATSDTTDMAVTIVPMALIPQIALANVVAEVEGFSELLARLFITAYWGFRGLATILPDDLAESIGSDEWSTVGALCVMLLHAIIFAGLAIFVLFRCDTGANASGHRALDQWLAKAVTGLDNTLRKMDHH